MTGNGGRAGIAKVGACLLFVALHAVAILLSNAHDETYSYTFLIAAPWIAVFAGLRAAVRATQTVRIAWWLFSCGLALWGCGMIVAAWSDLVQGASPLTANAADFFYFYYGVAIIIALGLPDRSDLVRRFFWIDALQAALAGFLAYVAIFDVVPFSRTAAQPIPVSLLILTYNIENGILVATAAMRVLARSSDLDRRSFDRTALLFLGCYAVCAALYNASAAYSSFSVGLNEILIDIPFLILAIQRPDGTTEAHCEPMRRHPLTVLVDGATPTIFTLVLLSLSFAIAQVQFVLGTIAMIIAMALYALRSALLQTYYLQIQEALAAARDRLQRLSLHDDLTGIANRRAFEQAIETLWPDRQLDATPLCLLLVDIDHFKTINDTLGHKAGDDCLGRVAAALRRSLRGSDGQVFRYGGEEFAVLLPNMAANQACLLAENLLAAVRRLQIVNRTASGEHVTISIGVAQTDRSIRTPTELMSAADRALYVAKGGGRNQVARSGADLATDLAAD